MHGQINRPLEMQIGDGRTDDRTREKVRNRRSCESNN